MRWVIFTCLAAGRPRSRVRHSKGAARTKTRAAVRYRPAVVSLDVSARAGIVVTGTEVLTGRVQDRNGPWIADRLLEQASSWRTSRSAATARDDIAAQLRFLADEGVDLIVTSGGLGPTADDMTVAVVAEFTGRELVLDAALEERIADILKRLHGALAQRRLDAMRAANRKQALVPEGAHVLEPVGTAPASSCRASRPSRAARAAARAAADVAQSRWRPLPCARCIARPDHVPPGDGADVRDARVGAGRDAARGRADGVDGFDRLEITTCLRRGEIEMVTRYEPDAAAVYARSMALLRERHGRRIFSEDGARVDDQVAQLLAGRRIATAESCTGGLLAARLTDVPGSSAYVAGGVVAYANEAKSELLGRRPS